MNTAALLDTGGPDTLETELISLAGRVAATRCHWLQLLAQFDASNQWRTLGFHTCAHWLRTRMGLSRRVAEEQLRVARTLADLPLLTERFSAGDISYAKVRAITRVATVATESAWLELAATHTAGQLEAAVRLHRHRDDADPPADNPSELHWRWDDRGNLRIRGTFSPEQGALLLTALEKVIAGTDQATPDLDTTRLSAGARRADALMALLHRAQRPTHPPRHRNNRGSSAHPRLGLPRTTHETWSRGQGRRSLRMTESNGTRPEHSSLQRTVPPVNGS